jgi:hypothetical protein
MAFIIDGTSGATFPDSTTQATAAAPNYVMQTYTSSTTWSKPTGLKAVKVTLIGAGGNSGTGNPNGNGGNGGGGGGSIEYIPAPSIPGPVAVTVGTAPSKTSSFGAFLSATGGTNGTNAPPSANAPAGPYAGGTGSGGDINVQGQDGTGTGTGGQPSFAGGSAFYFAAPIIGSVPANGRLYGGGGTGSISSATSGGAGIVIVEEFY